MNNVVKLPHAMIHCPAAWINFFEECCSNGPKDDRGDITIEYINKQLAPWRGRYDETSASLVFEDEKYLTWYYLRWT